MEMFYGSSQIADLVVKPGSEKLGGNIKKYGEIFGP